MWKRDLLPDAEAYALMRGLELTGELGNGADGNIWMVRSKYGRITRALKMHHNGETYRREREAYQRLAECGCPEITGFNIPVLEHHDDEWLALEMTIVSRPFLLDFAQASLDERPDFSEEVWEERLETWREMYEDDWPLVERALKELRGHGIYYLDVHRQNIALPL